MWWHNSGVGVKEERLNYASLHLCFILRRKRVWKGQERNYVQGIPNLLISMNISVLHGVWSYTPHYCVECEHNKIKDSTHTVSMFFVPYNANVQRIFALLCGRTFMKLGCDKEEKWNVIFTVYKAFNISHQRVKVISTFRTSYPYGRPTF